MTSRRNQRLLAAAASGLATLGAAAYANEKYAISSDINGVLNSKAYDKALVRRMQQLGPNVSLYRYLEMADQDSEAIWFEGRTWTFAQARMESDKIATLLHRQGIKVNDVVALFGTNSPEYMFVLCAVAKLGAVTALINTSLRSQTLAHCMNLVGAKHVVCTPDLFEPLSKLYAETFSPLPTTMINLTSFATPHIQDGASSVNTIGYGDLASIQPADVEPKRAVNRRPTDTGFYMFTSGTSGKPKAVNFKLMGVIAVATPSPIDMNSPRKYLPVRTYVCLPLFHATGLLLGLFYPWGLSGTACIGRRFSARNFSRELYESKATRVMYIGELARYLLKAPPSEYDRKHKVHLAQGNGMQADVWNKFRERYGIPEIREFYRSTEGIAAYTITSKKASDAGYVGKAGPVRRILFPTDTFMVRYDTDKEEPWRDPKTGFCVETKAGEPGEAIGRVANLDTYREYLNNPEANSEKLIRDVFRKGDLFQRTGDLLVRDSWQKIKFADRTGDTYRWNGENVSAGEVREHFAKLPGVHEVSVYAVKLEGYDGQAGAAGITLSDDSPDAERDFASQLFHRLRKSGLTTWQLPRLVRFTDQIEATATFKQLTSALKGRSWDPKQSKGDRLYWLDGDQFRSLDDTAWNAIRDARVRL